jgi:hypothetical protein
MSRSGDERSPASPSRFLMELHQGRTFCLLKLAIYVLFAIVCSGAGRRDFHGTIAAIATGLVYAA